MALEWDDGFESGTPATVFNALAGTPTFVADFPASGAQAMRATPGANYGRKDLAANAIKVVHFRLRASTFAGADFTDVVRFQNAAATDSAAVGVANDGDRRLFFNHTFGGTIIDTFPAITPDTYYQVKFIVDATVNPWSMSWEVNGVAQGTFAPARAATTFDRVFVGIIGGDAFDIRFDDVAVFSGSTGDYPPGDLHIDVPSLRSQFLDYDYSR